MSGTGLKSSDNAGGYKPTQFELEKLRWKPGYFKLSGDGIFHTLQGEGQFAGRPTTFIRLSMCNLQCSRCDAWYTRRKDTKEFYEEQYELDVDQLFQGIVDAQTKYGVVCRDITITGGEPLLQSKNIAEFLLRYGDNFDRIQIETNGTIPLLPDIANNPKVFFNCSPKISSSDNELKLRFRENVLKQIAETGRAIFKFVFKNNEDIDEIAELYSFLPKDMIWVMPEGVMVEEHRKVFDETIAHIVASGYNVAVRTQSVLWDGAKRGV